MIELRINNKSAEFGGLTVVRKNPAFNDIGDYTEPFGLANTDINRAATGYFDTATPVPDTEPTAEVKVMGDPYISGSAVFESMGSEIGGYMVAGKSHFYNLISGKTLRGLSCAGVKFPIIAPPYSSSAERAAKTLTLALTYSAETCDILAFPCMVSDTKQINEWYFEEQKFYNGTNLCPFLRLTAVLRFIFTEHGYYIRHNAIMDHAELKNLVVFNNIVTNNLFTEPDGETPKQWSKHLPDYSIKQFLADVETVCHVTFYINNATKQVDIVETENTLRIPSALNIEPYRTSPMQKKRERDKSGRSWSWAQPSDDDFAVSADLGLISAFTEVATEAALPEPAEAYTDKIFFARSTNTYWRYRSSGGDAPTYSRERFCTSAGALKTGNASYSRAIGLYPMAMHEYVWPTNYRMLMPRTNADQLYDILSAKKEFAPALLFYRGMQPIDPDASWTHATTYPLGSPFKHDVFGNEIQGADREFSTAYLESQTPLLNFWEDNPREYLTCRADLLPWRLLQQLRFNEPYTFGGVDVVLDEIKTQVDSVGIKTVELGMWRK